MIVRLSPWWSLRGCIRFVSSRIGFYTVFCVACVLMKRYDKFKVGSFTWDVFEGFTSFFVPFCLSFHSQVADRRSSRRVVAGPIYEVTTHTASEGLANPVDVSSSQTLYSHTSLRDTLDYQIAIHHPSNNSNQVSVRCYFDFSEIQVRTCHQQQ